MIAIARFVRLMPRRETDRTSAIADWCHGQPIGMTEHDGHIWTCFYDGPDDKKNPAALKVAKIKLGK